MDNSLRTPWAVVLSLLLAIGLAHAGQVIVVRRAAAAYDKSDITFWFNGEGYATGGAPGTNNCTAADITSSTGYTMDPDKEYSAGDTTGTFGAVGTVIAITTAAAITGSCGLEFDGGTSSAVLEWSVSSDDLINDDSGCMFIEFTRKVADGSDGDCPFVQGYASSGVYVGGGYRNAADDVMSRYDDGPNISTAISATDNVDQDTSHVMMARWNHASSPYTEVYLNGNTSSATNTTNVDPITIALLSLGGKIGTTCGAASTLAYYIDRVIISNDEGRCADTHASGDTLWDIAKSDAVCTGGCLDYDDF